MREPRRRPKAQADYPAWEKPFTEQALRRVPGEKIPTEKQGKTVYEDCVKPAAKGLTGAARAGTIPGGKEGKRCILP